MNWLEATVYLLLMITRDSAACSKRSFRAQRRYVNGTVEALRVMHETFPIWQGYQVERFARHPLNDDWVFYPFGG